MLQDRKHGRLTKRFATRKHQARRRMLRAETLESRLLLAADLYVDDNYAITTDQGAPGLDAGDTVTYGDAQPWQVGGLVYGTNAFGTIQSAVNAAAPGDSVHVGDGTYVENVLINKNLALLASGGKAVTTIQGISGVGRLGAVQISPSTTALQLGDTNQGFTIIGIDNGAPGIENAAVYFQGSHSNAVIRGNDIRANGEAGLITEYGVTISGFVIDDNIFSGQSFIGPNPAGVGSSQQFTLPNVPRQLVVMGGGTGGGNTSNITFTNNQITGTTGGLNGSNQEQGNNLITIDSNGATITGNTFSGTTSFGASSLRARGPNTTVSGNTFNSNGIYASATHLTLVSTGQSVSAAFAANTFDKGIYVPSATSGAIFTSIQSAIDAVPAGTTLEVGAGTYVEDVNVNKAGLQLLGEGPGLSIISGVIGGSDGATIRIGASNVEVAGFTITREGNNTTDWNDGNLNFAGVAVQGQSIAGLTLHDNLITGNRSAIDINNSSGHTIRNNVITQNHTGVIFRNQTDNLVVTENTINDNRTVGILFLDASGGSNSPVQTALNSTFTNNSIAGNWYGQIVDRQVGGSLPAAGTTNLKDFSGNWFGSANPVITAANSAEPGYASLIPVAFGGSATAPGGQPDIAGPASANFDITPMLSSGSDTNIETTPGRGTYGFQGNFAGLTVTSQLAQTGTTARIQEAVDRVPIGGTVSVMPGIYVENVLINKNLSLLSTGGRTVTTIQGVSGAGRLGAVQISPITTGVQIGAANQGFTIIGIDNGAPGIENAAVYFQGSHSNAVIRGNDIRANGDEGLTTEYGQFISNFVIDGNIFSGQSFVGANPAGLGTSDQFTLPNVPRPLVVLGGGANGGNNSNITFTNNQIIGTAGGLNGAAQEQGNILVLLDSQGATVSGNTFSGLTSRGASSIRARGPGVNLTGNFFNSNGVYSSATHLELTATGQTVSAALAANTFDKGVYVSGASSGYIYSTLQFAIDAVPAGTSLEVAAGTYAENITINKDITLNFAPGANLLPASGDALTITAGTTKINGTVNTGPRPTIIASGGTLGGSGKVTGPVTVQSGGFLSPGSSPGIISSGTYNQAGTLTIEIVNPVAPPPVAGVDYDQLDVTGTVTLTGPLSVNLSGTLPVPVGTSFKIINNDDVDAVIGTFTGKANGSTFLVGAQTFAIFYNGGDGNDVVLVAVAASVPTVVYVEDTQWNGFLGGQNIADADFGTAGNQVGVFGYDAFTSIAAAQAAVAPGGTIVVRSGTYAEAVTLTGTLAMRVTGTTELGVGNVTINSLAGAAANSVVLGVAGAPAGLIVGDANNTAYAGTITGPGALTKIGAGTLTLSNSASSYTGNTIINAGQLSVADVTNSGVNSPIGAGSTIQFGGGSLTYTSATADSSNRTIALSANGGVNVSNAAAVLTLSGNATGNTAFTKFGAGTLSWQPTTAAISNLHISGGILELDGSGTFTISGTILPGSSTGDGALATGSGTLNVKGNSIVNAVNISGNNQSSTTGTINQSGNSDVNISGMIRIGHWPNGGVGNYNISGGTLDLTGNPAAQVNQGAVAEQVGVIYLGIDGTGAMTVNGGAVTATAIVLDGRGDTTGTDTLTLSSGSITLGNATNATTLANSGLFVGNNNNNTTYQINLGGAGGTLRAATNLTSAVKMTLVGSGANGINIDTNGNSINLTGVLSGSGDLKKTGAGTLTLGAVNTYTGVTTVNSGTLLVNGSLFNGAATDDVVVNSGGTLGGTGTINGAVIVNAGGAITGGTLGGVGTLNIANDLSFNGGTYQADINGNTSDSLAVTGTIDLANAAAGSFAINSQTGTPTDGVVFTLINNTAAGAIIDPSLTGAIEGGSAIIGGKTARYTYTGGDGNNFTLTVDGGPSLSGAGSLEVRRVISGLTDNIQLLQGGVVIDSRPLSTITGTYTVNGTSALDTLLINYSNVAPASGFIPLNITFNGGAGGSDTLRIQGGNFDAINHSFTNANDGSILMDPTVGANTTITYTGLEPVLMNVGTVTDVVFNLPVGADTAILEDDNELVANTSQIRSVVGPTFERTTFTHPSGSLTINGGAGDVLQIAFTESLTAANFNVTGVQSIEAGNVVTTGTVSLTATANIVEYLPDATADISAGILTMNAATGINVDTAVTTLSAVNSTSGSILIDEANGVTLQNVTNNNGQITINTLAAGNVIAENVNAGTGNINITLANGNLLSDGDVAADIVGNSLDLRANGAANRFGLNAANRLQINATTLRANIPNNGFSFILDTAGGLIMNDSSMAGGANTTFDLLVENGNLISAPPPSLRDVGATIIILKVTGATSTIGLSTDAFQINTPIGSGGAMLRATSDGGNIYITDLADGLSVDVVDANGGDVSLQSIGEIRDFNGAAVNVFGTNVRLVAVSGIGPTDAIEISASQLAASNSSTGAIQIVNTSGSLLTLGTVNGLVGVNNNGNGAVDIVNNGGITVANNSSATTNFTLTTSETAATNENITVNAGVTVQADNGFIDFNAGDNFSIPAGATLVAAGNVTLDSIDSLVDPLGSVFDFFGNVNAANIAFNGSNTEDTFNIQIDNIAPLTHMNVDGNDPTFPTMPGDVLNIFGANLTLTVNGVGSGSWSFPGSASLDFVEIETVNAGGPYHLAVDMGAPGLAAYNSVDAVLDAANAELELRVDVDDDAREAFGGVLAFNGPITNIRSLAILGSSSGEVFSITQNANNLLPGQTGGLNNSSPFGQSLGGTFIAAGRTPQGVNPPAVHFSGSGGADSLRFNLNLAEDVGFFANGAGSGDANVQGKLTVSLNGTEKFESDQFAAGGSIVVDSSSFAALATMTITDQGALTFVDGDNGFTDVEFQNAGTVTIRSGSGEDLIDLVSINPTGLTSVTLDADNFTNTDNPVYTGLNVPTYYAADTIRVRSLPNVPALLLGGQGGDLFQLFNGANQTSTILGQVTINGEDGNVANTYVDNDRLVMIASGDVGPADVLVTETSIQGLTGFAGLVDVSYSNIDYIDITTTSGDDNIVVDMDNVISDMNIATVRGDGGQDDFDVLGVENFVPNAPVLPKFTDLFLFGDGPDDQAQGDIFGKNQDIFPSLSVVINIRGGSPTPVAPAGNIAGDTLFLDMSLTSANAKVPVLVDTVGKPVVGVGYVGSATSASHQPVYFNDIETFDVNDRVFEGNTNSGQTNVQRGDLYVRGQETAADRIILYHENPVQYFPDPKPVDSSRLRYNNTDIKGFITMLPTQTTLGKFIAYGRGGNDQITVSNSLNRDAELFGQLGNDYLAGSVNGGNDLLVGASGDDRLQGLAGNDLMWGDNEDGTGNGKDRLNGGNGDDVLYGGGGIDTMYGEGGNDIIRGEAGNDILGGADGEDILLGGDGNDRLNGGRGRDILIGGMGLDTVDGDAGEDIVIGDASNWDVRTPANDLALQALLFGPGSNYWNNLASPYGTRVNDLRSLIDGNIIEDGSKDKMIGDLDLDWFWDIGLNEMYTGKLATEVQN